MNKKYTITDLSDEALIFELQRRAIKSPNLIKQVKTALAKKHTTPTIKPKPANKPIKASGSQPAKNKTTSSNKLAQEQQLKLLRALRKRYNEAPAHYIHPDGLIFAEVRAALKAHPELMQSLLQMEKTGGKPDILHIEDDAFIFADFSKESPSGRRKLKYNEAVNMAEKMGVNILSKKEYKLLQQLGEFDRNTFSYLNSEDVINTGFAHRGFRNDYGSHVDLVDNKNGYLDRGWRASLRVPKV